ncbi:hypothetical protein WHT83_14865 [Aminobacter sp. P9b]|uniref:hypothetical protein n=1 Tax=Aminobacter sp. P9b TaxID=3133697 RepID=UPI00324D314A
MTAITLSRRALLCGAAISAVAIAAPVIPAAVAIADPVPAAPALKAFVVGTPGEYDWQQFFARTAEEAFEEWCQEKERAGYEAPDFDPDYVLRVEDWDGRDPASISPADWIDVGMGYCCERCGYETHPDCGCLVVAGEVVCEECQTPADRAAAAPDDFLDELVNRLSEEDTAEVRAWLEAERCWDIVRGDLWPQALAQAVEVAA